MEHGPGTDDALLIVEGVATDAAEGGRARITVEHSNDGGTLIRLMPTNGRACEVSLLADYPPQMDMFLGPEPTTASYELWEDDHPANLTHLRELLEAIVAGRYEQTIKTYKRNRIQVTGCFDLPSGEHTILTQPRRRAPSNQARHTPCDLSLTRKHAPLSPAFRDVP
jgi:hypothetical protein